MGRCDGYAGDHCWAKGLVSGLIGGFIGTILMTQFQTASSKAMQQMKSEEEKESESQQSGSQEEKEDTTMKAAGKIASVAGCEISHDTRKKLGPVVHYGFGTIQGGLYGMVLELAEKEGGFLPALIFGAALFGIADELAVPAMGLSGKPTETPVKMHLYALASHLVYGVGTEIARRGIRAEL